MNDPEFDPAQGDDKHAGEGDTCRICRSEGSSHEPLFYPCKCSGSIKFVHQDCLMEWLSHSNKKHCELCKTPFRFTKLYDSHMPQTLPLAIFVKRACVHSLHYLLTWARAITVALVWLVVLPWCIRWSWRGLFWTLDAGWARDPWLAKMKAQSHSSSSTAAAPESGSPAPSFAATAQPFGLSLSRFILGALFYPWKPLSQPILYPPTNNTSDALFISPHSSLLSDVKAINSLTPYPWVNRFILDVLEGEVITLFVVIAFILVFLIREWVVQQQPIINAAAHIRDAELQLDVAERAARRLQDVEEEMQENAEEEAQENAVEEAQVNSEEEAQEDADEAPPRAPQRHMRLFEHSSSESDASDEQPDHFLGWGAIESLMDNAGVPHEFEGEDHEEYMQSFEEATEELLEQLKFAEEYGISPAEVAENLWTILENMPRIEKSLWKDFLLNEPRTKHAMMGSLPGENDMSEDHHSENGATASGSTAQNVLEDNEPQSSERRPTMPPRDASSHAQRVLQSIEEGSGNVDHGLNDADAHSSRGSWQSVTTSPNPEISPSLTTSEPQEESLQHTENDEVASPGGKTLDITDEAQPSSTSEGNQEASMNRTTVGHVSVAAAESLASPVEGFPPATDSDPTPYDQPQNSPRGDSSLLETPAVEQRQEEPQKNLISRLFDWFWADIVPEEVENEPLPGIVDEEVVRNVAEEPPFVHVHANLPAPEPENGQDPEVLQAAAEAGLDAEAIEDAEDLEGVLELIGMQGPLVGLLQTAMFCGVLITTTLWTAIGVPYLFGKLALIFFSDPITSMVLTPLRFISFIADMIVDATVYVGGAATYFGSQVISQLLSVVLGSLFRKSSLGYVEFLAKRAHSAADAAAGRISDALTGEGLLEMGPLMKSIQAHQALHMLQAEVAQVTNFMVDRTIAASYHMQHSTVQQICHHLIALMKNGIQEAISDFSWARAILKQGISEAVKNGSFTLTVTKDAQPLDPSLAVWTSADRCLTVSAGYVFLAVIGTMYLLRKDSIFGSPSLQKIEKSFADLLKQAGGVLKVILIISIEMLVFPLYCGILLDCALLPLFGDASIANRLEFANRSPWLFAFLHWFIGTCYMFHFALFVSMCRRIMRRGVLYFIRDPDDPTFHPVRDVLERSVTTQLRKIAFSGLIYGGLVIVCLGGVVWSVSQIFGIFPIRWMWPESELEFPIDFLVYNLLAPFVATYLFPSKGMEIVFGRWLRLCARSLRLSQFLFGDRRKVEEGYLSNEPWSGRLNPLKNERSMINSELFVKDGSYVRAPASDQVRIPRGERVFLEVSENDDRVDGASSSNGVHGRQPENFVQVYIPPWFRLRIFAFISCLWMFAIAMGFGVTVVPMAFGRQLLPLLLPTRVVPNDLYAFAVGIVVLGVVLQCLINGRRGVTSMKRKASRQSLAGLYENVSKQVGCMFRSAYVYGFAVVVVPTLFALVLQLYLILPLHTYMGSATPASGEVLPYLGSTEGAEISLANSTTTAFSKVHNAQPVVASHTFHVLQDWTLGFIYGRVVLRLMLLSRNSRPAAALRLITRDGFTNPNVKLATRAFVAPTLLLFSIILCCPPLLASVLDTTMLSKAVSDDVRTKLYRYSYPICASQGLGLWCAWSMARGMQRWRGRIKDEVYLIGERLHNFGEKRPPEGSKSVVRKHG